MEKFAGYGFNKSHSAAYALLAYQTAYLKAHYPAAFMAAVMSADLDNTDRLVTLKDDCRKLGIELQAPNVNRSAYHFSVSDDCTILYGLGAIKGVGRSAVEALIAERETNGAFTGLAEFCRRVDHDKVNRRALEAMIKSGAMDEFEVSRRGLMHALPEAIKSADQHARAAAAGQDDMFGLDSPPKEPQVEMLPAFDEWPERVLLSNEKEALGLYLTGHPFDAVRGDARSFVTAVSASSPPSRRRKIHAVIGTTHNRGARSLSRGSSSMSASAATGSAWYSTTTVVAWKSACSARRSRNSGTCS